ncbi:exodeoxyribonuclease III [Candidatus Saccharibacteria bacterium]|nr:exodeoxyribonuclease III [Candidatus Saccharibacteria bacterium]
MNIYSWNINGIRAVIKKGEFQKFIAKHNPDILCLQETKAEQGQAEIDLPEYIEYWNSSRTKKGYSGTAIFTKIKPIAIINDIPVDIAEANGLIADEYGHSNDEGRVITAEFDNFYLVTAYTPNAKDGLARITLRQQWDSAITAYCAQLQQSKPVIYCGDMNVAHTEDDLANPKPNIGKKGFSTEERTGFDNWLSAGFVDTFRLVTQGNGHYTWWSHFAKSRERNVGWRIDYFLVSESLKNHIKSAKIHADQLGSDHCPISLELDSDPKHKETQ